MVLEKLFVYLIDIQHIIHINIVHSMHRKKGKKKCK